jgi:spermidine synthase
MQKDFWYTEAGYFLNPGFRLTFKVKEVLHKEKSPYQVIEVIDTYTFGKILLLDGIVMFTEKDEYAYHEMLVHPAMVVHPDPQNILIIGGGDGGTVREILKYKVAKITVVDIDKRVIEVCKKYFPEMTKGFFDSRVEIINEDGAVYVKETKNKFDIIFVDSTDPTGPGATLVEKEFLENGAKILASSESIWVAQTESSFQSEDFLKEYIGRAKKIFKIVKVYQTEVPSYGGGWMFTIASQKTDPLVSKRASPSGLKYYNSKIHQACFALPEYLCSIV